MGNTCCSNSNSATATATATVKVDDTTATATTAAVTAANGESNRNNTTNEVRVVINNNGSVSTHYLQPQPRHSESDVFHDAIMDRFPSSYDMSYPPTFTMRQKSKVDLNDVDQVQMLLHASSRSASHDDDKGNTRTTTTSQSVMNIKTNLEKEHAGEGRGFLGESGYPGELTEHELATCLEFREELKKRNPAYKEMVLSMCPYESEAFALCRTLRSKKFQMEEVFTMLNERNQLENWNEIKTKHNFYEKFHEIKQFNGCPLSVFLTQYPMIASGIGKNGAIVVYFKCGQVSVPGVECIVGDIVNALPFCWNVLYHETRNAVEREIKLHDPETTTVLAEKMIVVDLKGDTTLFTAGQEFLKVVPTAASCFPESVNRTYVLNAPFSFSLIWSVMKHALDPRTVQKIGFFTTIAKAKTDFLEHLHAKELLSDYGGNGRSYDEILQQRQKEVAHKDTIVRYIVELMCIVTTNIGSSFLSNNGGSNGMTYNFTIQEKEQVDSIVIFTRSNNGCEFSMTKTKTKKGGRGGKSSDVVIVVNPMFVSREKATNSASFDVGDDNKKPNYAMELVSSTSTSTTPATSPYLLGPGHYTIHAKDGTAKDYFLIAISVAAATAKQSFK